MGEIGSIYQIEEPIQLRTSSLAPLFATALPSPITLSLVFLSLVLLSLSLYIEANCDIVICMAANSRTTRGVVGFAKRFLNQIIPPGTSPPPSLSPSLPLIRYLQYISTDIVKLFLRKKIIIIVRVLCLLGVLLCVQNPWNCFPQQKLPTNDITKQYSSCNGYEEAIFIITSFNLFQFIFASV